MKGDKRKTEKADSRGGGFFLLPHCLLNSAAFRTLSPRATKLLLVISSRHNGFNNGSIGLSCRDMGVLLDSHYYKANSQALCELIERGFVTIECEHPKSSRLAREYRLTFIPVGSKPATNDYLAWKDGDAGSRTKRAAPKQGKSSVAVTTTRNPLRAAVTATGEETTRCGNNNGGHAKPPILSPDPVAITTTHIVQPSGGIGKGAVMSAAPDPAELRDRLTALLAELPRGSQNELAAMAQVRPAALSKFLNGGGPLADQARIRLTCALPKLAARSNQKRMTA